MAWYKGSLFVGTGRGPLRPLGLSEHALQARPWLSRFHAKLQGQRDRDDEAGSQIWRFDPRTEQWTQLYLTPWVVGADGRQNPRDRGVRARAVFRGMSDPEPALYFGVGSLEGQVIILRSIDGVTFAEAEEEGLGLGSADVPSIRTLCELHGRLYTSPTGKNQGLQVWDDNISDFPMVFETADPYKGHWTMVSEAGFGDPNNLSVNEMAAFNGCLYAGTLNPNRGFQVWKTNARGEPPYAWRQIIEDGAYRGPASAGAVSMYVFGETMYVGSGLQRLGRGHPDTYGPFPGELIRIYPDDTWDLVVGTQRFTPQGFK
ncbi:MAG: hypothetical protein ACREOH_14115, partial [Candidatus Entotheonellia bacterium]